MFSILVLCSANICRSPYAAELLRAGAQRRGRSLSVSTAGTEASNGDLMCALAGSRLERQTAGHSSRRLQSGLLAAADLVLTAESRHRAVAVTMLPSIYARVFTLREAAALAGFVRVEGPAPSMASWLGAMDAARGRAPVARTAFRRWRTAGRADDLDVVDGHGASARAHGRALDIIERSVDGLLSSLPWDTLPGSTARA